jgi:hypothetical protein
MTQLIAALLMLAASATAAAAAPKAWVGDWCLTESYSNGQDALTRRYIPRTNRYERPNPECPAGAGRFTLGPNSLKGLEFSIEADRLQVEGWPKEIKRSR